MTNKYLKQEKTKSFEKPQIAKIKPGEKGEILTCNAKGNIRWEKIQEK